MFQLDKTQLHLHKEVAARLKQHFLTSVPLQGGGELHLPDNILVLNRLVSTPGEAVHVYQWLLPFFKNIPEKVDYISVAMVSELGGTDFHGHHGAAAIPQATLPQAYSKAPLSGASGVVALPLSDGPFPWG